MNLALRQLVYSVRGSNLRDQEPGRIEKVAVIDAKLASNRRLYS